MDQRENLRNSAAVAAGAAVGVLQSWQSFAVVAVAADDAVIAKARVELHQNLQQFAVAVAFLQNSQNCSVAAVSIQSLR